MKIKKGYSPVDFNALADAAGDELRLDTPVSDEAGDLVLGPESATEDLVLGQEAVAEDLVLPEKRPVAPRRPLTFTRPPEPAFVEAPPPPRPEPEVKRPAPRSPEPPLAIVADSAPDMAVSFGRRPSPKTRRAVPEEGQSSWLIYAAAIFVAATWALAPIAFSYAYSRAKSPFDFDPFVMTILCAMAIGPAGYVLFLAYLVQQSRKLNAATKRAQDFTDEMIGPSLAAGIDATQIVASLREEIAAAAAAADQAQKAILSMRRAVEEEGTALANTTDEALRVSNTLAQSLGHQRSEMMQLAEILDVQVRQISETLGQNAEAVSRVSQEADAQMKAAEALLAARTLELSTATLEAAQAARSAGEDLTRHIARIETAGLGLTDQIESAQRGLTEQRAGLVSVTHALRVDQEAFAAQAETHAAQLSNYIDKARLSAVDMGDRVLKGGESLREIVEEAAEQFHAMTEASRKEREAFARANQEALQAVTDAALLERKRLEDQAREAVEALAQLGNQSRVQTERQIDNLRDQVDRLSEAAFAAGQKANQIFEDRLADANDLMDRSAQMVEQAGAATARKLDEGAERARATLEDLSDMLAEIESRAARLPAAARGQAEQVRAAVAESMDDLLAQARRTAEETQAIDAAFQDRVRRNYDMLSDAVRLMGSVAGVASKAPTLPPEALLEAPSAPRPRRAPPPPPPMDMEDDEPLPEPAAPKRTRLKLTPTASEAEFDAAFVAAGGRTPQTPAPKAPAKAAPKTAKPSRDEWTWKDLLTSIDKPKAEPEPQKADHPLGQELEALGIDAKALLPLRTIQDVAEALADQDAEAAHAIVKRVAPAGIRRLARRMLHDPALRSQALDFLSESQDALMEILEKRGPVSSTVAYLNTDAGRLYLLFEAAAGDLA